MQGKGVVRGGGVQSPHYSYSCVPVRGGGVSPSGAEFRMPGDPRKNNMATQYSELVASLLYRIVGGGREVRLGGVEGGVGGTFSKTLQNSGQL